MPAFWGWSFKAANNWSLGVFLRRASRWLGLWAWPSEAALIFFTLVWVQTVTHNTFAAGQCQDVQGTMRNHWKGGTTRAPAPSLDYNSNPEKGERGDCHTAWGSLHKQTGVNTLFSNSKIRLADTVLNFIYKWGNGLKWNDLSFTLELEPWSPGILHFIFRFIKYCLPLFLYTLTQHPKQPFKLM